MITSVNEWLAYLQASDRLLSIPLCLAGLALMLFGWRMWKFTVVLAFGAIGASIGIMLAARGSNEVVYALGCGAVLAFLSYWPVNFSLAVLGGLIGAAFVLHVLDGLGLRGVALWTLGAVAFLGGSALARINRQKVVICVTAFLGAVLLASGLMSVATLSRPFYGTFRQLMADSAIVLPFFILVPTVMSCFYQAAEVRRIDAEL